MGPLRSARRALATASLVSTVATVVALAVCAGVIVAAGPVAGSVRPERVEVRVATSSVLETAAAQLRAAWDAEMSETVVVFGDSISARFNDRSGHVEQGFWSMFADDVQAEPHVYAEGGSGFVNPGLAGCTGHTLADQLARPLASALVADAAAVVVEGGRTDTQTCAEGGGYAPVADPRLRRATDRFFARLAELRGADDRCTFVMVPWGPAGLAENRERVTSLVAEAAETYGFTFVWTNGLLTEETTIEDGVHPSYWGSRNLANAILDHGGRSCF